MTYSPPDAKTIQSLFNAIPERYDFLNSFLSFSLDKFWRRRQAELAIEGWENSILDIGVGTGKSLETFQAVRSFSRAVGCDFSEGMLRVARQKVGGAVLAGADMHRLPFRDGSFDLVISSFVLRSVQHMDSFLGEVKRILTPRGKFAFLDLTRPKNRLFWYGLYQPYLHFYLPTVGKLVSNHPDAYQFLSKSIRQFVEPDDLKHKIEQAGFLDARAEPLSFGMVTVFMGRNAL